MNKLLSINRCYLTTLRSNYNKTPSNILIPKNVLPSVNIVRASHEQKKIRSTMNYMIALGVITVGLSYAAVPLYRIFCQVKLLQTLFFYLNYLFIYQAHRLRDYIKKIKIIFHLFIYIYFKIVYRHIVMVVLQVKLRLMSQ